MPKGLNIRFGLICNILERGEHMRFQHLFIMLFAIALFGAVAAEAGAYGSNALSVTRTLAYESEQRTTYRTDAGATPVETEVSTVTLTITNNGNTALGGVALSEDISYLPAGRQVTFSTQPDYLDGRTARWNIGMLGAGKSAMVSYKVPGMIGPESLARLSAPVATYTKAAASLAAPSRATQGNPVVIALKDAKLAPLAGVEVAVNAPTGEILLLDTDAQGRAEYTPTDAGFYTYSVNGYDIASMPTTSVEQAQIEVPVTAGAVVPANGKASGVDVIGMIAGAGPIIAVILFLGIVAFALYAYLTTSEERQDGEPMPPAPATRPMTDDAEQAVNEKSGEGGIKYAVSYGANSKAQEMQDEERMQEQTRSIIEMRKAASAEEMQAVQEAGGEAQGAQAEIAPLPTDEEKKANEEQIEEAAEEIGQEQERAGGSEGAKSDENRDAPAWMTMEPYSGENSTVDDETIQKTIQELEALRAQLREKSDVRESEGGQESQFDGEPEAPFAKKPAPRIFPRKAAARPKQKKAPERKAVKKKGRR